MIRDVVADAIQNRLNDPRVQPLTSVTRVHVSPDFSVAHVWLSIMTGEPQRKLGFAAIRRARGRIRSLVADALTLRTVPELTFHLDDTLQKAFRTVELIDRAMAELGPRPAEADAAESSPGPRPAVGHDVGRVESATGTDAEELPSASEDR